MTFSAMSVAPADAANPLGYPTKPEDIRNLVKSISRGWQCAVSPGHWAVTPGTGRAVNVAAGQAYVNVYNSTSGGQYYAWADVTQTVSLGTQTADRYYAIVLAVGDSQYGTAATQGPQLIPVQSTTSGGSAAPTTDATIVSNVPAGGWFRLADVLVRANYTTVSAADIFQDTVLPILHDYRIAKQINNDGYGAGNSGTGWVVTADANHPGLNIWVPPSGRVEVGIGAKLKNPGSATAVLAMAWGFKGGPANDLITGSATIPVDTTLAAPNLVLEDTEIQGYGTINVAMGRTSIATGLTPGLSRIKAFYWYNQYDSSNRPVKANGVLWAKALP